MTSAAGTRTSLRRRTVLATAIALIGFAGAASAFADPVDLQVVDRDTGQPLQLWRHDGRLFVAGQPGARYSLRVANHTDGRVLVVMSVDGVNILTGETAGYGQRGYVFGPYESYDVSGWRKSDTEVAAFTFAPLPQSYAARTGRPGDVGVIGMAVFRERVVVQAPLVMGPMLRPERRDGPVVVTGRRAAPAPAAALSAPAIPAPPPPAAATTSPGFVGAAAARQDEKLGTAHGAREWSVVNTVPFERATPYPQVIRQIEYDTHEHLVAAGVIPPSWNEERRPRPFPSTSGEPVYVPDPPGGP